MKVQHIRKPVMVFELHVPACPLNHTSFVPSRFPAELDLPGREKPARLAPNQNCVTLLGFSSNTHTSRL